MIQHVSSKRQGKVLVEFTEAEYWDLMDMYASVIDSYSIGQIYKVLDLSDREHLLASFEMYQTLKLAKIV